ncbi:MAG TPA: type I-B CRISPR-associated protein Cas8b1/Cst1 [Spirochaetota bacterium]|nr:type I-B CRISPR-associated protein Cas8b1/Cst1 [Spirochaetota bacterium]
MIRIYLRDWYYNTGMIGFLNVLSEGKMNISEIINQFKGKFVVQENYLEFDPTILEGFYEKYKKFAFDIFFNIESYKERLNNLINKTNQPDVKISKKFLQETALSGKIVNAFIKEVYGKDLNEIFANSNIVAQLTNVQSSLNSFQNNINVYTYLSNKNSAFINYFLDNELARRICSYEKINDYLAKLSNSVLLPKNNDQKCYICGEFKKEYDLSNAITQISGFNKDNSNWIWGFQSTKAKICPLCALIYSCVVNGIVFINKKIGKDYKTFFYALNRNSDIATLYSSYWIFKEKILQQGYQDKPFYTILQEVTIDLINQKAHAILENINFIEISENEFGGQGTRSYNVYNYNITKQLAEFIQSIGRENIPKGFYIDRDIYYDLTEEILKKTLEQTLGFSDLSKYFECFVRSFDTKSKIIVRFSIYKITNYILKYINQINGGNKMAYEQIVTKAFHHGKILGEKIGQENKIKGVSYQLLNDLKISDRNSFMDKYLRLCMSYGTEVKLGSNNELTDMDNFMSFGYAFVNGVLANIKAKNIEEGQNG